MKQITTFLFSLTLLAFICFQSNAFPIFRDNSLRNPLINAHAESTGIIQLQKDPNDNSFYVEADLCPSNGCHNSSNSSDSTTSTDPFDTVKMMISIANDETMVAEKCLDFDSYDCSEHDCHKSSYAGTVDFPSFHANVTYAKSHIYLDTNYWILESAYLYIAQSCHTGASSLSFGSGKSGVLGLGTGSGAKDDFKSSPIFSIFINSDLTKGQLLFKKDTNSYAQASKPLYTLYANCTWQIPTRGGSLQVGDSDVDLNGNVMFDINSDAIGLPESVYNVVMTYVTAINGVTCEIGSNYKPSCATTKQIKDLPDIILSFGSSDIKIPSQIYASLKNDTGSVRYFNLNFKATSPNLTDNSYISQNFKDSIILDANFMSYYYTVFDASNSSNMIYLYPSINVPSDRNLLKWIGAGAGGVFLLVVIGCCCIKKKKNVDENKSTINNNTTADHLSYNRHGINNSIYDSYPGYYDPSQLQGVYHQVYQQVPQRYVPPVHTGATSFKGRAK